MAEGEKPLEFLVIDDDPEMRNLLKIVIEEFGGGRYNVTTARDGQEGIDEFVRRFTAGNPYDAVFTDLMMDRADGLDVARKVKELSPETEVRVVTGVEGSKVYNERLDQVRKLLGADSIVYKPYELEYIEKILTQIESRVRGEVRHPNDTQPQKYNCQ